MRFSEPACLASRREAPLSGMAFVPGGAFRMGSDQHYPEEAPAHDVSVDGFWIDLTPVMNREFRKFVNATGYVTFAEIKPDAKDYPGALPHMLKAGSLVFTPPKQPVNVADWSQWWRFKFGANWRHPYGPRSSISDLNDHPVVHIAYRDAEVYANWAGKELLSAPKGNSPPAVASKLQNSPGATSLRRSASIWPTPGRENFHIKILRPTVTRAPRLCGRFRRTATASTI